MARSRSNPDAGSSKEPFASIVASMTVSKASSEGREWFIWLHLLLLILSAAGLGASFAVLFDVWNDLSRKKIDHLAENANWMRIGLGVVAGLILAEIVSSEGALTEEGAVGTMAEMPFISAPSWR